MQKHVIKVAILGNYPVYPFARELGIAKNRIERVTTWNMTLVEALSKRNDVDLRVITGAVIDKARTIKRKRLAVTYLPMPRWPNILSLFYYTISRASHILREFDPDVAHGIGTEHIWPLVAVKSRKPSVLTVHGVMTNIVAKMPPPLLSKRRYFAWLEPRVLRHARHVISINPYVHEFLSGQTNGVIHSVENPVSNLFFRSARVEQKQDRILFVGGVERLKGLHVLIEALGLLSEWSSDVPVLDVVGPESDVAYSKHVRELVREKGLADKVRFLGFMLPDDLVRLYTKSAILVQPSFEESFSMVCAEAMSAGLPVIASDVGGMPHVVKDGASGILFPPGDAASLAAAVHKLWSSNELRESMGQKGRAIALSRWKPELIADKTVAVYRSALAGEGGV